MEDWVDRYPFVGNVRGAGLFIGMDLVRDKASREPISKATCQLIFHECLQRGLLTMAYTQRFRIQPAMTIDEETVDSAAAVLAEVFDLVVREGCWK